MKKLFGTIFALFYLTLASGASINMHYCGGALKSININSNQITCCCGVKNMANTCCEDEEFILDADIDEYVTSVQDIIPENVILLALLLNDTEIFQSESDENDNILNYIIPPPKPEPKWLLNCSLTYYG